MDSSKATSSPRSTPLWEISEDPWRSWNPELLCMTFRKISRARGIFCLAVLTVHITLERGFVNLLSFMDFLKPVSYFLGHLLAYDMHMCVGEGASKVSEVFMKARRWHPISWSHSCRWLLATLLGCWKMNSSPIQELLNFLSSSTWVLMGLLLEHVSLRAFRWKMEFLSQRTFFYNG